MATTADESLAALYLEDETAWLEAMAELVRRRDLANLDLENLAEYLSDMAKRDRRDVKNRLAILLVHLLKWQFQPEKRSRSWQSTILAQSVELADLANRGVLRSHAEAVLENAYATALKLAMTETGLPGTAFPSVCPFTVEQLFAVELADGDVE